MLVSWFLPTIEPIRLTLPATCVPRMSTSAGSPTRIRGTSLWYTSARAIIDEMSPSSSSAPELISPGCASTRKTRPDAGARTSVSRSPAVGQVDLGLEDRLFRVPAGGTRSLSQFQVELGLDRLHLDLVEGHLGVVALLSLQRGAELLVKGLALIQPALRHLGGLASRGKPGRPLVLAALLLRLRQLELQPGRLVSFQDGQYGTGDDLLVLLDLDLDDAGAGRAPTAISPEAGSSRASATAADRLGPDVERAAALPFGRLSWAEAPSIDPPPIPDATSARNVVAMATAPAAFRAARRGTRER